MPSIEVISVTAADRLAAPVGNAKKEEGDNTPHGRSSFINGVPIPVVHFLPNILKRFSISISSIICSRLLISPLSSS